MKVKIKEFATVTSGSTPLRSMHKEYFENGTIPWVKTMDLTNGPIISTDEKITSLAAKSCKPYSTGTILVAMYGGFRQIGRTGILTHEASINQALSAIDVDREKCFPEYLIQYLNHNIGQWRRYAASSRKDPNITSADVRSFQVQLPPLPEQKAIANLLSTWDEAIEKADQLIRAKEMNLKGQIQKMIGSRAVEENGWSMAHLGDLFSEVIRKVGEKKLIPYSISAGIGFVSQREKWGKDISGSQHKNYTHLKAGEFSYNKGNSKRYKQGCVYLNREGEICVPNVFISFKPKINEVVPEFFEHYFIADYHARELKRYITSGARSDGLLNLNKKDFFKIMVPFPPANVQKAIAEALTASQHEIDLLKQLAEKYKNQKRGLMQKMLTGEWRVKPEIVNQYKEA